MDRKRRQTQIKRGNTKIKVKEDSKALPFTDNTEGSERGTEDSREEKQRESDAGALWGFSISAKENIIF